jgi:hypothetical protein
MEAREAAMKRGTILIEDCLANPFGFRVRWEYESHSAKLSIYEIVSRDQDNTPYFHRDGATISPDNVKNIQEAEVYLSGYIKWDGCSELDQGCPHWCGPTDYKKHIALLEWSYRRAQELMEAGNWSPWDDE